MSEKKKKGGVWPRVAPFLEENEETGAVHVGIRGGKGALKVGVAVALGPVAKLAIKGGLDLFADILEQSEKEKCQDDG